MPPGSTIILSTPVASPIPPSVNWKVTFPIIIPPIVSLAIVTGKSYQAEIAPPGIVGPNFRYSKSAKSATLWKYKLMVTVPPHGMVNAFN